MKTLHGVTVVALLAGGFLAACGDGRGGETEAEGSGGATGGSGGATGGSGGATGGSGGATGGSGGATGGSGGATGGSGGATGGSGGATGGSGGATGGSGGATGAACTKQVGTDAPFATIQSAVDEAVPGDVICVLPGTYTLSSPIGVTTQGTSSAPVEIRAEGSVTLTDPDAQLGLWSGMFEVEGAAWVTLRGFQLVDISWFGVRVQYSDHVTVDGFKTENSLGSGIFVLSSTNVVVTNNDVGSCCLGTSSEVNGNGNVVGSQECITIHDTSQFEVGYNDVHDSPVAETGGEGIDAKAGSSDGRIHHNRVHDLVRLGIYVDGGSDIEIDSNEVFRTQMGVVIASEGGGSMTNFRVHDNILHHNGGDWAPTSPNWPWKGGVGLDIPNYAGDGPRSNIAIYNNTIVSNTNNGEGAGIRVGTVNASDVVVRNNLISGHSAGLVVALATTVTEATNNLVYPFTGWTDEMEGSDAVHAPPLFVGESSNDYHLQGTSPAVDAGRAGPPVATVDADGKPRVVGSAVDIGAFEYDPNSP